MRATLDLALDLKFEFGNFYSAMAYPGSAALLACGFPRGAAAAAVDRLHPLASLRDCLPLPTRHLPAREVLRFRDAAFLEYYT